MRHRSGFTLVELLIAMAIIGILASVVPPRLQGAQEKGVETSIIASMESFNKTGKTEEIRTGDFNVVCGMNGTPTSTKLLQLVDSIKSKSTQFECNSSVTAFAASAQLDATTHWCVDSAGNQSKTGSALGVGDIVCP